MTYALIALVFLMACAVAMMVGKTLQSFSEMSNLRSQELRFVLDYMREQQEAASRDRLAIISEFTAQIDTLLQQAHAQREQLLTRIQDPQVAITQIPVGVGDRPDVEVMDELAELREQSPELFDENGNLKVAEDSDEFLTAIRPVEARQPFGADNGSGS